MRKKLKILLALIMLIVVFGCARRENRSFTYGDPTIKEDRISYASKYRYPSLTVRTINKFPYLRTTNHLTTGRRVGESERHFLDFYKNLKIQGYGDSSTHWRWFLEMKDSTYSRSINKALYAVYLKNPSFIYTLENNKWIRKKMKSNPVGRLKNLIVLERGKSGIVTQLLIRGSKGEYLVRGEYSIRDILGLNRNYTKRDVILRMAKSGSSTYTTHRKNPVMLPSGYFAIEQKRGKYYIYGGGFGHGVGMSQYGAYDLTTNYKKSYKDVLNFYYKGVDFKNLYSLKNVSKNIRVGLTGNDMSTLEHSVVTIKTQSKSRLSNSDINLSIKQGSNIKINPSGSKLNIYIDGQKKGSTNKTIKLVSSNNKFQVTSLKRRNIGNISPIYRGSLEIKPSPRVSSRARLINEVYIEDYLLQVVPSEMPKFFGVEALKAQAVAARTYALSDYLKGIFRSEGFHVKDNTMSQVYNNTSENPQTSEAVRATKGLVMLYNGKPIDAKYYSTSSGFGSSATTVW